MPRSFALQWSMLLLLHTAAPAMVSYIPIQGCSNAALPFFRKTWRHRGKHALAAATDGLHRIRSVVAHFDDEALRAVASSAARPISGSGELRAAVPKIEKAAIDYLRKLPHSLPNSHFLADDFAFGPFQNRDSVGKFLMRNSLQYHP